MLHTLMQSPFKIDTILLFNFLKPIDDFLALQDGVLISLKKNFFLKFLLKSKANLYVLDSDLQARGISNRVSDHFLKITYRDFVFLTKINKMQMNW
ncbi:sulfurtransferase complex subunit TusB [Buchnera aphidicola (Mindarus keteleerifoliae)]|uniref:sulfurtransferase complex subunit TusB n=1 Tax=Buchnera aphidicola TaxID=9 RepID=UPI0031B6CD50